MSERLIFKSQIMILNKFYDKTSLLIPPILFYNLKDHIAEVLLDILLGMSKIYSLQ